MGALAGVLVVSVEQAVAAPLCTQRLRDAGARVIKVERPEGDFARRYDAVVDGESAYFLWLNRGKESIALNLRDPEDRALLDALIARADVFVQNLAPGAAERSGFGSAELRRRHPRLITCAITGYGADTPYATRKAYDLLIQCETGLAATTGTEAAPGRTGASVADIAAGMNGATAVLEALYERERTGEGRAIAISLFDSLAEWMTVPLLHHDYGGKAPARVGLSHPSIAPYGAFACRDGRQVVLSVQNEREWARFCDDVLGEPALRDDPRFADNRARIAHRPALDAMVATIAARLDSGELVERLTEADIAWGMLNEVVDVSRHPALRRMAAIGPAGPVTLPANPLVGDGMAAAGPPRLNAHGDMIRKEFG
jgi:itaconate CoA-transferase